MDWIYLESARKGDQKAFSYIYKKYSGPLLAMSALITGSADSAKDVVQETFVRLMNAKIRNKEGNFKSYITKISYRLALKEKSRSKRLMDISEFDFNDNSSSPVNEHVRKESQMHIFNAISSLDDNHKNILVLRFYGGLTYESIAEAEGLPIGTVKSRIYYAVKACREILKNKGVLE